MTDPRLAERLREDIAPIAWRVRRGASDVWGYCETEADADFYGGAGEMRYVKEPLFSANHIEGLIREREGYQHHLRECEQIAGKALGYPWFKDDQKNFPGTTEADGVCIGEHVGDSIVEELANRLQSSEAKLSAAVGALEFYADAATWQTGSAALDLGRAACQALLQIKKG